MQYPDFVTSLTYDHLSPEIVAKAKSAILDTIGAMIGGLSMPAARIMARFAGFYSHGPCATLLGQKEPAALTQAVLANATAASALDIDDCQKLCVGHPGAIIVPAALALAETEHANGRQLLTAVTIGYEIGTRFGAMEAPAWDSMVLFGAGRLLNTGAAAAAAHLMGLSRDAATQAIGMAQLFGPTGHILSKPGISITPMAKEAVGWGAMTAVAAAQLVKDGFSGPVLSLPEQQDHIGPLGQDFTILSSTFKPYPSCRFTHPAIDAILSLKAANPDSTRSKNVSDVEIRVFKKAMHMNHPAPPTAESAQYSIPYTAAVAIRDGEFRLQHLRDECLADPELLSLAGRIRLVHEPAFDRTVFDRKIGVTLTTFDGRVFSSETTHPKGDLESPMNRMELESKFLQLTQTQLSSQSAEELIALIGNLESLADVTELMNRINPVSSS